MTAKELATMFSGLKIPVPEMEEMIEDYRNDELEKFCKRLFDTGELRTGISKEIAAKMRIESYLKLSL